MKKLCIILFGMIILTNYAPAQNVGIGTTIPATRLHVDGGSKISLSSGGYFITGNTATQNLVFDMNAIQARNNGAASGLFLNYYGGITYIGPLSVGVQVGTDGTVGIKGANNSSYALNVNGSSLNGINIVDPVNGYGIFSSKSGTGNNAYFRNSSTTTSDATVFAINYGSGAAITAVSTHGYGIDASCSGAYGIGVSGTSTSSAGVYGVSNDGQGVYGISTNNAGVVGITQNSATYAGYFQGNVYSTGSYQGSDQKLKQNITDLPSGIDIINQLHPKKYQYRQDGNYKLMNLPQGEHYGLIAQDVEKILPNLIKESKFETRKPNATKEDIKNFETINFKALNYTELIPVIIKGMQEQQLIIEKQQLQINELKEMVNKISGNNH